MISLAKREENLAKNTLIYAIGSIGSKIVQIILVPLYARVMTNSEFGTVDLMQAVVQLLLPIVALSIFESVFRYAMEKNYDRIGVLSVGIVVSLIGSLVMAGLAFAASAFMEPLYVWLVVMNTFVNVMWTLISQYTRAIDRNVLFAVNNILITVLVLVFNVLFLVVFKMGVTGYMLGYTFANLFSTLFLIIFLKKDFRISFAGVNKKLVREMLLFSLPLMLNGICWWLSSFTDRVMIVSMISTAENGIYAAASKIPHLLSVVVTIFYQAWQISANQEFGSEDVSKFYSDIYEKNSACTFLISSALILFCRPVNTVFLGEQYKDAWILMPTLILSTTFFSFAQFLIAIYSANKKTKMALITNVVGMVSNIAINAALIPLIGALGAAIATAASYLILWVIRIFDTRKIVKIDYRVKNISISMAIILLQTLLICLDLDYIITYTICGIGTLVLMVLYRDVLLSMVRFALKFVKR